MPHSILSTKLINTFGRSGSAILSGFQDRPNSGQCFTDISGNAMKFHPITGRNNNRLI